MAASYGNLSPVQREAIYELKKRKKSGSEIREIVAKGYKDLPPFSVSAQHANAIARKLMIERDELFTASVHKLPPDEAVETLVRRLIVIADRESLRLQTLQNQGKLDAVKLAKLADALGKLQRLLDRMGEGDAGSASAKKGDGERPAPSPPSSFAESLLEGDEPEEEPPEPEPEEPGIADRVLRGPVLPAEATPSNGSTPSPILPPFA